MSAQYGVFAIRRLAQFLFADAVFPTPALRKTTSRTSDLRSTPYSQHDLSHNLFSQTAAFAKRHLLNMASLQHKMFAHHIVAHSIVEIRHIDQIFFAKGYFAQIVFTIRSLAQFLIAPRRLRNTPYSQHAVFPTRRLHNKASSQYSVSNNFYSYQAVFATRGVRNTRCSQHALCATRGLRITYSRATSVRNTPGSEQVVFTTPRLPTISQSNFTSSNTPFSQQSALATIRLRNNLSSQKPLVETHINHNR
jgi:hypothetical protein